MRWRVLSKIKAQKKTERQEEIIKALFKNRGLRTKKQQEEFLQPQDPYQLTPEEVGLSSVQIKKAFKRIKEAIKKKEKVIVYGDYDTDGVCATAIMWEALRQLGAEVMPFIPKRGEGYGLKTDRLKQMAQAGVKLVVTVDQGIVHSRQAKYAQKVGIDLIITDHHTPGEKKPPALAVIHTTQLAGCGVAWFFVKEIGLKPKLDLVTIGTVTDVMPLLGPNRSIVKFGLKDLQRTKRPGLLALYDFAALDREKIGTYEIGFIIGPRLNAAGRMEDPMEALRLICTPIENRAIGLAQKLNQKNRERQDLMNQITKHARKRWLEEDGQSALIFVYHESYEHGVVGLAARQLMEEFYRPAIVLAPRADHWVASARSIEEFNIVEAIQACADFLSAFGGHAKAAGFSVDRDKIEPLRKKLIGLAEEKLGKEKLDSQIKIETEVSLEDLNFRLYQRIKRFEPFGMANPQPVLAVQQVKPVNVRTVGKESQHLKFQVASQTSGLTLDAIGFGMGQLTGQLSAEEPISLAANLLLDEWNGQKKLQLRVKDLKI